MEKVTFLSEGRYYICAEGGGGQRVVVNRRDAGPWEEWIPELVDEGLNAYAFRADNGQYMGVEPSTGFVFANRPQIGPWEQWEVVKGETDGTYGIRSIETGKFLRAAGGGGGKLVADAAECHAHECFTPSNYFLEGGGEQPEPGPTPIHGIHGQLRTEGIAYFDDEGPCLPLLAMFLEAFSMWVRNPAAVEEELDSLVNAGYDGVRVAFILGYHDQNRPGEPEWAAWAGKEVTPVPFTAFSGRRIEATPDYYPKMDGFLRACKDRGLVVHFTNGDLNGLMWEQVQNHLRESALVQVEVDPETIALNEVANEWWQNTPPDTTVNDLHFAANLYPNGPLRATSCGDDNYGGETPSCYRAMMVDVGAIHPYRGGESHDRLRHIFSVGYDTVPHAGVPPWYGEPIGPDSSVAQETNPEALCMLALMAWATKGAWVHFPANGAFHHERLGGPGFTEVPQCRALLPGDVQLFEKVFHGGESWAHHRIFAAVDTADHRGLRCDHVLNDDGRAVVLMYGPQGSYDVPVERNFDGEIITPHTGERHPLHVTPGQTLRVDFERGRLLVGRYS